MKSIIFDHIGKPADSLACIDSPLPEPGPNEVRIKVIAAPINPSDTMFVQNLYGIRPHLPSGAGFEGVGVVEALGEGVQMRTGMRVSFTSVGTWADYAIAHQRSLIPVPDVMTDEVAAQLFVNPFTAYAMVQDSGVSEGGWLMITAAGSAFGKLVIQLCQMRGIRTIGTVRRDDLNDELKALGLTEVINTETEKMAVRVREITGGHGVSCVLDAVGGHTASEALTCLAKGGTLFIYGLMSLQDPAINAGLLIFRELTVKGFWLTDWMRRVDSQTRQLVAQNVISLLSSGKIQLPVEASYSLDQIKEAVEHADRPGRWGKILLKP
ncbi:zinc-dependent alcohol dehydrogenase family protein [Spirosoma utsteinense]|uniref:NADPH:quinone reductase-like Zn-dependent oxidoreductase n=1 Tax=Spirosoma utsteinense TaxID=2585773 RepID=A0ABR6W2G4_9BACT|nr:zinc-dependent alcohol dehydrogenase family protein [Spirosoma utsteinense]MBC3785090.1 NADPH:quinone reductase-like Zn-dependent oxidoreductase [Spirosoma utsteinense]MBC3790301.1 NADPH:quinone reductase-like Zn-dependent oxidoreductase [Spirosoma utsteinense]